MAKWYFALSEASLNHKDHDWISLIRVAVKSALERTTLRPHFIYDGDKSAFTDELEAMGVIVIYHRVTFYDNIAASDLLSKSLTGDMYLAVAAGAFLRVEIPLLELDDEFVIYTDCDVMFLANPAIQVHQPTYFACAPQRDSTNFADMNSGVMVMNVPALRRELAAFTNFICEQFCTSGALDQECYQRYYSGRYDPLPPSFNWKPYWGSDPNAEIVHFHGPKPLAVRKLFSDTEYDLPDIWRELFNENVDGYRAYLRQWDEFQVGTDRFHHAHTPI